MIVNNKINYKKVCATELFKVTKLTGHLTYTHTFLIEQRLILLKELVFPLIYIF